MQELFSWVRVVMARPEAALTKSSTYINLFGF